MGTISKKKTRFNHLKQLNPKDSWADYSSVYEKAQASGYTPQALYNWIKKGWLSAWIKSGVIMVRTDAKLPPPKLTKKKN